MFLGTTISKNIAIRAPVDTGKDKTEARFFGSPGTESINKEIKYASEQANPTKIQSRFLGRDSAFLYIVVSNVFFQFNGFFAKICTFIRYFSIVILRIIKIAT